MRTQTIMLLFSLVFLSASAYAEIEKFGNVDVNYNVITTDALSPSIAKAYGIERNKHRLLLTVAVSRTNEIGLPVPVPAAVTARTVNLMAQEREIPMRNISENGANYYLGEFDFARPDILRFTLNVSEAGAGKPHQIEFERNFDESR